MSPLIHWRLRMETVMTKNAGSSEKGGRAARRTAAVQVEKDLARMAAVIASHRGVTQSDVCSPVLRPHLLTQYRLVQEEITRELRERDREK
jgi:hypothetical protein